MAFTLEGLPEQGTAKAVIGIAASAKAARPHALVKLGSKQSLVAPAKSALMRIKPAFAGHAGSFGQI
jgi:hypothetical protein